MKYATALAKLGLGLVSAAALAALPSASAQATASKEKAASTLVVVYEFTGSGVEKPSSKEKHVNWDIKDRYELKTNMSAKKPSGFGALHKADAATQARESDRQKNAESAAKDMAPMMAGAEQIMAKCGEDEQCLMRESMKLAQGMDPAKAASAKSKIAAASVMPADRYQLFESSTATGTYTIDERSYEAYFDAACSFKNEATCAINKTVKGSGALTDGDGKTTMKGMVIGELDLQAGSLIMTFPLPGAAKATKTITSASKDQKSGTEAVTYFLSVPNTQDIKLTANCGACKTAEGSFTKELDDKLLGRKGTLKVSWKFTRG
jgi:hypothetical protein